MRSMTGYGRDSLSRDGREITVELKSVNHRYLDLSFRLPRALQFLEPGLRRQISREIARGHVDITLNYRNHQPLDWQVVPDEALARGYALAAARLAKAAKLPNTLKLSALMQLPDVLKVTEQAEDEDALALLAGEALAKALGLLVQSREAEGAALKADLADQLNALEALQAQMAQLAPQQTEDFAQRLNLRLKGLQVDGLEPQRLAGEVALFADRVAVDEELSRLASHITQMRAMLSDSAPQGRKMDFLTQEMGREVNTIGSKANLLSLTRLVLEAKNCVEKLREQIQNLE